MDERVARLKTTNDCEIFARNARRLNRPDLALEAERRAIEILAQRHESAGEAERLAIQAIYAYEHILSEKNGRRKEKGMQDLSFEAIVLRYLDSFSSEAVSHAEARLTRYKES